MHRALVSAVIVTALLLPSSACSSGGGGGGTGTPSYDCGNGNTVRLLEPCAGCTAAGCNAEASACFGSGWGNAQFSGVCQPLITCLCTCNDQLCADACVKSAPQDCQSCLTGMGTCLSTKCPSQCPSFPFGPPPASGGSGGSGASSGAGGSGASAGLGGLGGIGGLGGLGASGGLAGFAGGPGCFPPEFPCFSPEECCSNDCSGGFCK